MFTSFPDRVRRELIPVLRAPTAVVDEMGSRWSGNGLVILRVGELRVQVTGDRGETRLDVGSMATPHVRFDDQLLAEHLGLGRDRDLIRFKDAEGSLRAIGEFLNAHLDALSAIFAAERFAETRAALEGLQGARVARMFPEAGRGAVK